MDKKLVNSLMKEQKKEIEKYILHLCLKGKKVRYDM